jgi:hypothetical protein
LAYDEACARTPSGSAFAPSSYYAPLFDIAKIAIEPAGDGPRPWPDLGVATISEGDLDFEILTPTEDGRVPKRLVSIAQPVVSLIVEMDDSARAVPTDPDPIDFDEVLAYVVIRTKHHQVRLLTVVDSGSSFCKSAPILI